MVTFGSGKQQSSFWGRRCLDTVSQIPDKERHDDERQQAMPSPRKHIETKAGEGAQLKLTITDSRQPEQGQQR